MADINEQVVGTNKPHKENRKTVKLEIKELKLKTSISDEQYAEAHFQEFFRRTTTQIIIIMAIALNAQAIIAGTFTNPEISILSKIATIALAIGAFFVMPMVVKTRWQHMKENNDFWLNEQSYTMNVKGVAIKSNHGDRRLAWREFSRIFETKKYIIMVLYKFHMVVLPLADFDNDEKRQIRELIRHNTQNLRTKVKLNKSQII